MSNNISVNEFLKMIKDDQRVVVFDQKHERVCLPTKTIYLRDRYDSDLKVIGISKNNETIYDTFEIDAMRGG